MTPFEYAGGRDSCIGCADLIHAGDLVAAIAAERPDWLLCVACWWAQACDLPLPRWARSATRRTNLARAFVPDRPER
ncbi:MAG TPA: hypothetical protein VJ653_07950 [Acidimicrobiales bacterium]|nr:hypothetical protein [Acidimicrobiales bacterium]